VKLPDRRDEGGAIAIVVALLAVGLLVIAGFTVDFGQAYVMKRNLQTGADAASLAGAQYYMDRLEEPCTPGALAPYASAAETQADDYMEANVPAAVTTGDNLTARCDGTAVKAYYTASANTPMVFGGLAVGGTTITTGREAEAGFLPGGAGRCALCFLSPAGIDAGNAEFTVNGGGSIHVNGNISAGPNAFYTSGGSITISGTTAPSQSQFTPDWTTAPPISDPFASLAMPLPTAGLSARSTPCTGGPGIYGAVDLPNGQCTLAPGAYVVTGKWAAKNSTVVSGSGVTLYVQGPNGELDFKNGSTQNLTAPATPPLAGWPSGFVVIYDRSNTRPFSIQGNGSTTLGGIVYLPNSSIDFNGNSCLVIDNGALVAKDVVKANGNHACLTMNHATNAGHGAPASGLHLTE
jgi:Putative Flp pilus-assembly TadE/G-like